MRKVIEVTTTLRGVTPLMLAQMSEDTLVKVLIQGERPRKDGSRPLLDVANESLYRGPNDEVGIPAECMFACLAAAGQLVKYDAKRGISTAGATLMPSFLTIEGEFFPLIGTKTGQELLDALGTGSRIKSIVENDRINLEEGWYVDIRRGQLDNGTAVAIVRPRFEFWGVELKLTLDLTDSPMTEDKVKDLVGKAGMAKGLGSFRPGCKGRFGQFKIESWTSKEVSVD